MSSSTILPSIFHFLTSSDATWSFASIAFMATFLVFFLGYLLLEPSRRRRRLLAYTTAFSLFFAFKANGLLMLLLPMFRHRYVLPPHQLNIRRNQLTLLLLLRFLQNLILPHHLAQI